MADYENPFKVVPRTFFVTLRVFDEHNTVYGVLDSAVVAPSVEQAVRIAHECALRQFERNDWLPELSLSLPPVATRAKRKGRYRLEMVVMPSSEMKRTITYLVGKEPRTDKAHLETSHAPESES